MLGIGLISGTSADGVSAALIQLHREKISLIACLNRAYPPALRRQVLNAADLKTPELSLLNVELGEFFAQTAQALVQHCRLKPGQTAVIGSHGQTVYHGPKDRIKNTFQIAEPSVIAERTGIAVVADFRPRDIAAGGEGAPLVPFFDWFCYRKEAPVALLNIGGIANITLVERDPSKVMGFDTGPGNCLLDLAVSQKTKGRLLFDEAGALAYRGRPDNQAVDKALRHPFFKTRPPKSTGREFFDKKFLMRHFGKALAGSLENACATLGLFTAKSIALACRRFIFSRASVRKIIASGGGSHNVFILSQLQSLLGKSPVVAAEDDIPAQAKEPMAFALMALMAVQGKPNHLPSATGAKHQRILGAIYPA